MSLESNMQMAIAVAALVRQRVPKSSNYMHSSSVIKRADGQGLHSAAKGQVGNARAVARKLKPHGDIEISIATALALGAGNCGELASVACQYLKERGGAPVERVLIRDGPGIGGAGGTKGPVLTHVISVLGRAGPAGPHGLIGLPNGEGWGEDAVICDPWEKVAYPAAAYEKFWDGLYKVSREGRGDPKYMCCYVSHKFS